MAPAVLLDRGRIAVRIEHEPANRILSLLGVVAAGDPVQQHELVQQQPRQEEMLVHALPACAAECLSPIAVAKQLHQCLGRRLGGVDEDAARAVRHLQRDATGATGDHGRALPQRLGDDEPEALANRLLQDDRREPLERVDFDVSDAGQVREELDRVVCGRLVV